MGDRGNIAVVQSDKHQVWFYTHWCGSEIQETAQAAVIAGKSRWNDPSYFTRCVADKLIPKLADGEQPLGFGISCSIGDNEHEIMVLDCERQIAYRMPERALNDGRVPVGYKPSVAWTFAEFAALPVEASA